MPDLRSSLPLYVQLRELLREEIEKGRWKVGDQLPGENELVRKYGVARSTVRQALLDLVNEGLLYRKQGRGTFVCRTRRMDVIEPLISYSAEMTSRGLTPGARVLKKGRCQDLPEQVVHIFGSGTPLYYIERLRTADNVPMALEFSYIDENLVPGLDSENLEESLYQILVHKRHIQVTRVDQSICPGVCSGSEAGLLELEPGAPVLILERTIYTGEKRPFYWLKFVFRGDVYRLHPIREEVR